MSLNVGENEDSDDEWFYSSFQRYDDLLMYDVQGSISCASFISSSRFLLAASGGHRHELWELSIPKKLIAGKDAGLTRDRDFSVITAGYTSGPVKRMLPIDSGVVASESSGINFYSIPNAGDETDIISLKLPLREDTKDAPVTAADSQVFSGMSLSNIISFDLKSENSKTISLDTNDLESISKGISSSLISELSFTCGVLHMCLKDTGSVLIYDPRQNLLTNKFVIDEPSGGVWTMDVNGSGSLISTLGSKGLLQLYDNRNFSEPMFTRALEIQDGIENTCSDHICVRLCPSETLVSVSGLNRNIQIFDFKRNDKETCVFNHDGHRGEDVQNIVTHLWHELQEKLVFSADNTGQLQAWRFKS